MLIDELIDELVVELAPDPGLDFLIPLSVFQLSSVL